MAGVSARVPRVVITGGGGFLGNAFAVRFRERARASGEPVDVVTLDRRPGPGITLADVTDPAGMASCFSGADLVVHAAALVDESRSPEQMWEGNVEGTRTVLAAASQAAVPVVHLSSVVVHGPAFPDGVDETGPIRMSGNPYTDTKVAAEHQVLLSAGRGHPVTIVRPGDVYGPGSEP